MAIKGKPSAKVTSLKAVIPELARTPEVKSAAKKPSSLPEPAKTAASVKPSVSKVSTKPAVKPASPRQERYITMTNETIEKTTQQVTKAIEDATSFNKETINTLIKCSTVVTKGAEEITRIMMAAMQANLEHAMSTSKAIMGVKTMRDLVDIQTTYSKSMVDSLVKDSGKITEVSSRVANEVIEPISARVTEAVTKFGKAA